MNPKIPRNNWKDSDVEAHWDSVASVYVEENNRVKDTHDQRFGESIQYLQLEGGESILNISSRDGEAADHISRACGACKVVNAEISSRLMEVASEIRPHIHQKKINTYSNLPFGNGEFERILTLERLLNYRFGASRADDRLPDMFFEKEYNAGRQPSKPHEWMEPMIHEFYAVMGWDDNGQPTEKKLEQLDLLPSKSQTGTAA